MSPLTKRIDDNQQALVALRDQLTAHLEAVDDDNVSDAELATTQELNKKIADREAALAALKEFSDEYASVEHLLIGILESGDTVGQLLKDNGVNKKDLVAAIKDLRKGAKVTSQSQEETYNALNKYAKNLNQLAKAVNTGSLPVTPETEADLKEACRDVAAMRADLMRALGKSPGGAP